ncbi:hypothetical protein TRFO_23406 [Tritrichomonas foetus]|uniref:Thioredoxin domain-containing protein n=1 Tax=Tritrichomonas foetus TaxID=1144522 RepID=A0A1J4KB59_9EUKA|nr:hypothetical protein TRFO_23406 [Tritrichomonas foetus]|eukprot:OHT08186.1 hypothetical protein TRFO_23406 [Tritrichomonas foetus]
MAVIIRKPDMFFLLAFRLTINETNYYKVDRLSLSTPILIYFFRESDPSRNDILPVWNEFMSLSSKNEDMIVGIANCTKYPDICNYFRIVNTSAFLADWQKVHSLVSLPNTKNLTVSVFVNITNDIKNKSLNSCPVFIKEHANYPAFVFKSRDSSACSIISRYSIIFPNLANHLYFQNSSHVSTFTIYHNQTEKVDGRATSDRYQFVREYSFFNFGNWSMKDAKRIRRRFAIIVYSENDPSKQFESMASDLWKDFAFNKMTLNDFNQSFYLKIYGESKPFMLVSNVRKSKFYLIKDISNVEAVYNELKKVQKGAMDYKMEHTFEPLFGPYRAYSWDPKNMLQFAIVAFSVIGFTALVILRRASKCINPNGYKMPIFVV